MIHEISIKKQDILLQYKLVVCNTTQKLDKQVNLKQQQQQQQQQKQQQQNSTQTKQSTSLTNRQACKYSKTSNTPHKQVSIHTQTHIERQTIEPTQKHKTKTRAKQTGKHQRKQTNNESQTYNQTHIFVHAIQIYTKQDYVI